MDTAQNDKSTIKNAITQEQLVQRSHPLLIVRLRLTVKPSSWIRN